MDCRIVNTSYSRAPVELFCKVASLCLTISETDDPPNPPFLVEGTGRRKIGQVFGECPHSGGVLFYYSLHEDGVTVQVWDCEEQGYDLEELGPPLYTFPLNEFDDQMRKIHNGEI